MRSFIATALMFLSLQSAALTVETGEKEGKLDTEDIINSAVECEDCLEWELLGICFWLKCSLFSCDIETSVRVGHYIPDFVVSAYTFQSEWDETSEWNDSPSGAIAKTEDTAEQDTSLDFKSVDIIVHPAILIFNTIGSSEYFCESGNSVPMLPHFLSAEDPNWNDPGIEQLFPQSISGLPKFKTGVWAPVVGDGYWAPLYPRCGWGAHPYDPINAAVAAHRAAEIVTRNAQPHIYLPATGSCENKCWKPGPVSLDDNDNRFQLVAPDVEKSHRKFGGSATWANGKHNTRESYLWNLWRYYSCCEAKGAYITHVDIEN